MSSRYFCVEDFFTESGEVCISPQGEENLFKLCEIVMNSHYSYASPSDKEDLRQVGLVKALELLHCGSFDPTRSSLKNYLYTGIRNEMKNYLYKNTKDVTVDDEILIGMNENASASLEENLNYIDVDESLILSAVGRLLNDEKLEKIKASLKYMGFDVGFRGTPCMFKEVEKEVCLVVWKRLRT